MENVTVPKLQKPWYQVYTQKFVALLFWVILFVGYQWYAYSNYLAGLDVTQNLIEFLANRIIDILEVLR